MGVGYGLLPTPIRYFSHGNIIKYTFRPFFDEVGQKLANAILSGQLSPNAPEWRNYRVPYPNVVKHNEQLIANWNSVVKPEDHVYHLGDFCFGNTREIEYIRSKLNGRIFLIKGNHDNWKKIGDTAAGTFEWVKDYYELQLDKLIVLCHYAFRTWRNSCHGSLSIFGHSHSTLSDDPNALSMDVGVDAVAKIRAAARNDRPNPEDYAPISYNEVKAIMSKKTFKPIELVKLIYFLS